MGFRVGPHEPLRISHEKCQAYWPIYQAAGSATLSRSRSTGSPRAEAAGANDSAAEHRGVGGAGPHSRAVSRLSVCGDGGDRRRKMRRSSAAISPPIRPWQLVDRPSEDLAWPANLASAARCGRHGTVSNSLQTSASADVPPIFPLNPNGDSAPVSAVERIACWPRDNDGHST